MSISVKIFLSIFFLSLLTADIFGKEFELYVVDIGPGRGPPWRIIKYDEQGQNPEIFISSELNRPQDIIFLEDEGTALVSNLFSGRITKYNAATGAFIGDFATGIAQPTRMKIGADNLLYVLQWASNSRVLRYALDGTFIDSFTDVGMSNSIGMDWDSQGNLYVASFDGRNVRKFDTDGNDMGLFISSNLSGPTNIWFDTDGDLLVMDWSGLSIRRFNSSGGFKSTFVSTLREPEGIEFLDNGDFLIGNGGTSSVKQYNSDGNFVKDFIAAGSGGLAKPNALRIRQVAEFQINAGLNDAWFNPDTSGQGFFVTVFPDLGFVTMAWFTYDTGPPPMDAAANLGDPGHRWLTAAGSYAGNQAVMNIDLTSNGIFDTPTDVQHTEPSGSDGTLKLVFENCNSGTIEYDIPSINRQGMVPIRRVADDNIALCQKLNTN